MEVTIRIPSTLRTWSGGREFIALDAATVEEALVALDRLHPDIRARLCDESGRLRRFVRVFVGEVDIRTREGQQMALRDGDLLDIVQAIC